MVNRMKPDKDLAGIDLNFAKKAALHSEVDLFSCYQCGKCTNGCPVAFAMDYHPHQVIRLVQIGLVDEIKGARTIWVCASCETCFTRCPNEIKIADLMDYLKGWVLSEGEKPVEGAVAAFHQSFLKNIKKFGRIHETALMRDYLFRCAIEEKKIEPKMLLKNIKLGLRMLKRGRLSLIPQKTGGKKAVRELYKKR